MKSDTYISQTLLSMTKQEKNVYQKAVILKLKPSFYKICKLL